MAASLLLHLVFDMRDRGCGRHGDAIRLLLGLVVLRQARDAVRVVQGCDRGLLLRLAAARRGACVVVGRIVFGVGIVVLLVLIAGRRGGGMRDGGGLSVLTERFEAVVLLGLLGGQNLHGRFRAGGLAVELQRGDQGFMARHALRLDALDALALGGRAQCLALVDESLGDGGVLGFQLLHVHRFLLLVVCLRRITGAFGLLGWYFFGCLARTGAIGVCQRIVVLLIGKFAVRRALDEFGQGGNTVHQARIHRLLAEEHASIGHILDHRFRRHAAIARDVVHEDAVGVVDLILDRLPALGRQRRIA